MIVFIAGRIMNARDKFLEEGQAKYRAYFVNTNLYLKYKLDVDAMLIQDKYSNCIIA